MFKEILTDKNFIENVIRRFIYWMVNLTVLISISFFVLSFMTEETVFEVLSFLSLGRMIRVVLAMIIIITVSEILKEYRKRYTL